MIDAVSALITLAIALLLALFFHNDSPARSILTRRSRRALAAIVDTLLPGEALIGKPTSTLPGALDAIEKVIFGPSLTRQERLELILLLAAFGTGVGTAALTLSPTLTPLVMSCAAMPT